MDKYPQQTKFYYIVEELHVQYGLSLEGKLAQDLDDEDLLVHYNKMSIFPAL